MDLPKFDVAKTPDIRKHLVRVGILGEEVNTVDPAMGEEHRFLVHVVVRFAGHVFHGVVSGHTDAVGADDLINLVEYGRWPVIFLMVIAGLGLLYKLAPNRPASKSPWISVGALVVAVIWLLATVGFSVYMNNAGSLGATYGALAGAIALMLWLFISGLIVFTGAELNAELESRNLAHRYLRNGRQP